MKTLKELYAPNGGFVDEVLRQGDRLRTSHGKEIDYVVARVDTDKYGLIDVHSGGRWTSLSSSLQAKSLVGPLYINTFTVKRGESWVPVRKPTPVFRVGNYLKIEGRGVYRLCSAGNLTPYASLQGCGFSSGHNTLFSGAAIIQGDESVSEARAKFLLGDYFDKASLLETKEEVLDALKEVFK